MRVFLALVGGASAINIRSVFQRKAEPLPFDCYLDDGKEYVGLKTSAASGRECMNWTKSATSSGKGIGNHNYCRNPNGEKARPWCYNVDTEEKEECEVPKCEESKLKPEKWVAENKGEGIEPCKHEPPKKVGYKKIMGEGGDKACHKGYGGKQWLIGLKLIAAADVEECTQMCQEKSGAEFMTFFDTKNDDGANCGCYRDACIQKLREDEDDAVLTLNGPHSYKLGSFNPTVSRP